MQYDIELKFFKYQKYEISFTCKFEKKIIIIYMYRNLNKKWHYCFFFYF